MRGNLTGERRKVFTNGELDGLNLIPIDPIVRDGISQTKDLAVDTRTELLTNSQQRHFHRTEASPRCLSNFP